MATKRFFYVMVAIAVLVLAACAPQAATETPPPQIVEAPTSVPSTSTSAPSPEPAQAATETPPPQIVETPTSDPSTSASASSPEPASTPGNCPCFEGLSSGLDNAAQARVRTVSMVMGAPRTDVYVNGMPALNGGVPQGDIGAGQFSGWLYVAPGSYTIALVPHGGTIDQALFAPTDVKVEAGHRYTVAAMGQLADQDVHPLLVDETTLEAGLGASASDNLTVDINNMTDIDGISEQVDHVTRLESLGYGEAGAFSGTPGNVVFTSLAITDGTSNKLWEESSSAEPGTSFGVPWFGPYPSPNIDAVGNTSQGTSDLNVLDFLGGFNGLDLRMDGRPVAFNILLNLIERAGLHDQFVDSGPYFFLAPTDEAFSAISQADLDALADDPQAVMDLIDAHLVDGYFPFGSLSGRFYGHAHRTVTNRSGQSLAFVEDTLNGLPVGRHYTVGNGNRVQIIFTLLPSE